VTLSIISILLISAALLLAAMVIVPVFFGSPWHPTSKKMVRRILEFCEPEAGQVLIDPGSGDGRVLVIGAKEFGLRGIGLEIDPLKVFWSRWNVRRAGLTDRVSILHHNLFDFDYREADILFLYLTHQALDKLIPKIREQLKPTVKIVSYRFCIQGMTPDKVNTDRTLFLYTLNRGQNLDSFS